MDNEKHSTDHRHSISHSSDPKEQTEANILPETADEPQDMDLEKAQPDEMAKAPAGFDPSSFPDGGMEAWLAVSGAFCCLFCSFGWINGNTTPRSRSEWLLIACATAIGVFQTYYEMGPLSNYSASTISWIPALEVFMMFLGVYTTARW